MTRIKDLDDAQKHFSPDVLALNPHLMQDGEVRLLNSAGESLGSHTTEKEARPNKYGARKTTIDGEIFDSRKEARRWLELRQQLVHGQISNLQRQVNFTLQIGFDYFGEHVRPITYTCDFAYTKDGIRYIEDCKSVATMKTADFRIRWRLLQYSFKDSTIVRCVVS